MTPLHFVALAAELAAAITAILLARRRAEHVPAAWALAILAVSTCARAALVLDVIRPARAALPDPSAPFTAPALLAAIYLDGALELAAVAALPGLALAVLVQRPRRTVAAVVAVWVVASVVLGALYPSPVVRGAGLQRVYLAADLIGLFVAVVALIVWARRGIAAKRSPGSAPVVAMALVALDAVILLAPFSPWRASVFAGRYDVVQVGVVLFFATFAVAQGVLWNFSPR